MSAGEETHGSGPIRVGGLPFLLALAGALLVPRPARAMVLWDGSADKGVGVFEGVECVGGMVTVAQDPAHGAVWKIFFPDGDERCEVRGSHGYDIQNDGGEIYVGWQSRYDVADGTLRYVFQMKGYPTAGKPLHANHPVVWATEHDRLVLINYDLGDKRHDVWSSPISRTEWVSIVMHMKMSDDPAVGFIELWWNGARQKLASGSERYPANTFDAGITRVKWGVYRGGQGPGDCTQYLATPRIGTTYEEVAPGGAAPADAGTPADASSPIDGRPSPDGPGAAASSAGADAAAPPVDAGSGGESPPPGSGDATAHPGHSGCAFAAAAPARIPWPGWMAFLLLLARRRRKQLSRSRASCSRSAARPWRRGRP